MKFFMTFAFMAFLGFASVAQAQDIDLGKITCAEFLASDKATVEKTMIWLDGYISALSENTVMSAEWMQEFGEHMGTYCTKNPSKTILDAVDALPSE